MPQEPTLFAPLNYRDYAGEAIASAPPPAPHLDGDGQPPKPFEITTELLQQLTPLQPRKPYSYNISDPIVLADRYLHGLGHTGYVGADSENFNAVRQSTGVKWINGLAKGVGNAVSTFVAGTVGLFNGLGSMLSSPVTEGHFDFSKFYDNYTNQKMEDLTDYMEKMFPHYQTNKERDAAHWYSPDNWATANFWANGFLANLGFAAGALASGEVFGAVLSKVPQITEWALTARKFMATGDFAKGYKIMEQALGVLGDVDDVHRATVIKQLLTQPDKLQELGISAERLAKVANAELKFKSAFNQNFISTMGAVGESSMEAQQGLRTIRENLIQDYKDKHNGELPDATAMTEIESRAKEGANWRWWFNLATLSVSNNIQFPRLLSNGVKNQMRIFNHGLDDIVAVDAADKLVGEVAGVNQKYARKAAVAAADRSKAMKLINPVWQFMKNPITLSESVEEGLQYAYEKSTESYEQMQYDGHSANLVKELLFTGIPAMFKDREGIESMLFGGLTGKLMDMTLGRRAHHQTTANTEKAIDSLNSDKARIPDAVRRDAEYEQAIRNSSSPYMEKVNAAQVRHQTITDENNKAVAKGDINRMRDLDEDFIMNYAMPRIQFGRTELLKDELRQFHSSRMTIEAAREGLGLTAETTSEDLDKAIDRRIKQVDKIASYYDFITGTLSARDPKTGNPRYADREVNNMIYDLFKIDSHQDRYDKLISEIQSATGVDMSALTDYNLRRKEGTTGKGIEGHKSLDEVRNEITTQIRDKVKQAIRNNPLIEKDANDISVLDKLRDLESIQNTREAHVKSYHYLREQTADREAFDSTNADTVEGLMNIEEQLQYPILIKNLDRSTMARTLAVKTSMALEALDDKNVNAVLQQISDIEKLLSQPGAFMYAEDITHFREIVKNIKSKLINQALESVPRPAEPIAELETMSPEDQIDFMEQAVAMAGYAEQSADIENPFSEEQINYMGQVLQQYDQMATPLARIENILNKLDKGEPATPLLSEIKRQLADNFMDKYPEISQAVNNPDYDEVEELERLLGVLQNMKKLYSQRPELLVTKAFNQHIDPVTGQIVQQPFLELLDERIAEVESWLTKTRERRENILKDDALYYEGRVANQWAMLGVSINAVVRGLPPEEEKEAEVPPPPAVPELTAEQRKQLEQEADDLITKGVNAFRTRRAELLSQGKTVDETDTITQEEWLQTPDGKRYTEITEQLKKVTPAATKPEAKVVPPVTAEGHILHTGLYESVAGILGEETVLKALAAFQSDYKQYRDSGRKEKLDFEKHILGLIEQIKRAPDSTNKMTYRKLVGNMIEAPVKLMQKDEFSFRKNIGDTITPYMDMVNAYRNNEEQVLQYILDGKGQAYADYLRHKDINRLFAAVKDDITNNKFDYGRLPTTAVESILFSMMMGKSASYMKSMLDSTHHLVNIYNALKLAINEQQTQGRPTPSDKQMMSLMELILHAYDKSISPVTLYDPLVYLNGRIGAGKTAMTGILLRVLAKLEQSDMTKSAILAGDTRIVGLNLEQTIGMNQTSGNGTSIQDVIAFLNGAGDIVNRNDLRFIVIDEAARAYKDILALAEAVQAFNKNNNRDVRVFLMGDSKQVTGTVATKDLINSNPAVHVVTSLTTSFRGKVSSINTMQSIFENAGSTDYRSASLTFTANVSEPWDAKQRAQFDELLIGVSGSPVGATRPQQLARAVETMQGRKDVKLDSKDLEKAVIVNAGKEQEWIDRLEQAEAGLSKHFTVISYYNAQGKTFDEVYLDLDVDPTDPLMSDVYLLNTGMYTAGRARNFIYLINNPIDTKQDASLTNSFRNNTRILNKGAEQQYTRVASIAAHLSFYGTTTVEEPKGKPEEKPPAGPVEPPLPSATGKPAGKPPAPPAAGTLGTTETPPGGSTEDSDYNEEGFTSVPESTEDQPEPLNEQVDGSPPVRIGDRFFVKDGNLGVDLGYPTGGVLHWYNNIPLTTDPGDSGRIVYDVPRAGEGIAIVSMPLERDGDVAKYGVFRHTSAKDVYQLLAVVSNEEVDGFIKKIPEFAAYHQGVIEANKRPGVSQRGGIYGMLPHDKRLVAPDSEIESFYRFNESLKIPSFLRGTLHKTVELNYEYNPADETSVAYPTAVNGGIDWIPSNPKYTGTDPGLLQTWYNQIFRVDPITGKPRVPNAPSWDEVKRSAKVNIVTIDKETMDELTLRTPTKTAPYTKGNVPVKLGKTYLRISNVPVYKGAVKRYGKPQFIALKPAILNKNYDLHRKLYIDPIQNFLRAATDLSLEVNKFIVNVMKDPKVLEDFEDMWRNNSYSIIGQDAAGDAFEMVFKRDTAEAFNISSNVFNDLAKRLINMDWEDTTRISQEERQKKRRQLGDSFNHDDKQTDRVEAFYNQFFNALRQEKLDEKMSGLARKLRQSQKLQNIAQVTDKSGNKSNATITYAGGAKGEKIDLRAIKTEEATGERLGQVAFMNFAQSNGSVPDPVTGKKTAIVRFSEHKNTKGEKEAVREAYDLLESSFDTNRPYDNKGKVRYDMDYIIEAYNAMREIDPDRIMHVNVFQFKALLNFLVKGGYFEKLRRADPNSRAHNYKNASVAELYTNMLEEKRNNAVATPDTQLFRQLVRYAVANYNMTRLNPSQLNALFVEGFDENTGQHTAKMRINIPMSLSKETGRGKMPKWEDPADPSSTSPLGRATPQDRMGQMLATDFTGIKPTQIDITLNSPYAADEAQPTQQESQPTAPPSILADPTIAPEVIPVEEVPDYKIEASAPKVDGYRAPVAGDQVIATDGTVYTIKGYSPKGNILWSRPDPSARKGVHNSYWTPQRLETLFGQGYKYTGTQAAPVTEQKPVVTTNVNESMPEGPAPWEEQPPENKVDNTQIPTTGLDSLTADTPALTLEEALAMDDNPDLDNDGVNFSGDVKGLVLAASEAHKYLKSMVPGISDDMIEFLDRARMLKKHGVDVLGRVANGAVVFQNNGQGIYSNVVKHEAFHAIFRYFTGTEQRDRILNAAVHYYGLEDTNPERVEEFLAREFGNRNDTWLPSIIRSFFNWVARLFNFITGVTQHEYEIKQYYNKIESGAFSQQVTDPLLGAAHFTNFEDYYQNDYTLYRNVLTTFANDYQKMLQGGRSIAVNGREISIPLGPDEVVSLLHKKYKRYALQLQDAKTYEELPEELRKRLGVNSDATLKAKRMIYNRLAEVDIYTDLVKASYPDKFKFSTKTDQDQWKDRTDDGDISGSALDEDMLTYQRAMQEVNLNASINSDNDLNPRSSLTDRVNICLQTIMAPDPKTGAPVPVSKEFSTYTLYHNIHNMALDVKNNPREAVLRELEASFRDRIEILPKDHPLNVREAMDKLNDLRKEYDDPAKDSDARLKTLDEVELHLQTIQTYYNDMALKEPNPNVRHSIEGVVRDIKTIRITLSDHGAIVRMPGADRDTLVKENLLHVDKLVSLTQPYEPVTRNHWSQALYNTLRRIVIDTYSSQYIVKGKAPVHLRSDRMFTNEDTFLYKGHKLRRDGRTGNEDYFNEIIRFIQKRNDKAFGMEDVIALWRHRQAYNMLADIMSVVNNSYVTKPFRLQIEEKNNNYEVTLQNIVHNDVAESQGHRIMVHIDERIRTTVNGQIVFSDAVLQRTRHVLMTEPTNEKKIVDTFYSETLNEENIPYNEATRPAAAEAITRIVQEVEHTISDQKINPEEYSVEDAIFGDNKGYLRAITEPLISRMTDRNLTSFKKGDGKIASGIRQMSFGDNVLSVIKRYQDNYHSATKRKTEDEILTEKAPYLMDKVKMDNDIEVDFWRMNPINPLSHFSRNHIELGNHRMFDSHKSLGKGRKEWITPYRKESNKDILTRLFVGNYISAINQRNLFPTKRTTTDKNKQKIFTIQPFYVMAERERSQGIDMELLPTQADNHIGQMLFQMLHRPLSSFTKTFYDDKGNKLGVARPFDNKDYNPYYSPFKSVSSAQLKALRERMDKAGFIQKALKEGTLSAALEQFMGTPDVKEMINNIKKEFEDEAKENVNFILRNVRRNSYYKSKGAEIMRTLRRDTGFRLPSVEALTSAYNRLYSQGILSEEDIRKYGGDSIEVAPGGIVLKGYSGNLRNVQVKAEHLMPLMVNFASNHFIRGYFLAQMTMDDNSVYSKQEQIIKRMGISTSGGKAYFNIGNILREQSQDGNPRDRMKFLVIDDIVRYRNLGTNITKDTFDAAKFNEPEKGKMTQKRAKEIIRELSKMSQLTQPQFDNYEVAYTTLYEAKQDVTKLAGAFKKINFSSTTVNDAQGWVTERGHDRFAQVGGPGINTQDLLKPSVLGRDQYGVARPCKFAVETLTDRVVADFPTLFELRFQADFGHLREVDPKLHKEAYDLERERIDRVKNSPDPERPKLLLPKDEDRLNEIYNDPLNRPAHMVVPQSAVKFNCPETRGTYNYVTDSYESIDHYASSFTISMKDIRVQQNPVNDAEKSSVALPMQFLYMSNTNGNNFEEMSQLFGSYAEIQRIGFEEINEEFPMNPVEHLGDSPTPEQMVENMKNFTGLMINKYKNNPSRQRALALLKQSRAGGNDPSTSEDVFMQSMAALQKNTGDHRLEGMKLVQLSPGMRKRTSVRFQDSEEFAKTGFDEPVYNQDTLTAEVYLPEAMLNKMRNILPGKTDEELRKLIPVTYAIRIPGTGLNSGVRVTVKGFYPSVTNAIIGPADMHLIMGSDFDADALFMVLPRYATSDFNKAKARDIYGHLDPIYTELTGKVYENTPIGFDLITTKAGLELQPITDFARRIKQLYDTSPGLDTKKIYRDIYTAYLDNNQLHQYTKILGKKSNKKDVLSPITFDVAKNLDDRNSLFNLRASALSDTFKKEYNEAYESGALFFNKIERKKISNMRDSILSQHYNVNTVSGMMRIQRDTMGGAGLIGIEVKASQTMAYNSYAVNPGEAIKVSYADPRYDPRREDLAFIYDGKVRHQIGRWKKGHYDLVIGAKEKSIFEAMQWIVNSNLDAVKEGISPVMNLTYATANAWTAGLLMEMDEPTIQSFMNLPVVKEISDYDKLRDTYIYIMQRELMMMRELDRIKNAPDSEAELGRVYAEIDEKYTNRRPYFDTDVAELIRDVKLNHATTREYEKYSTLQEASRALHKKETNSEFEKFIKYNMAALDQLRKMNAIGNAWYTLQRVTNIVANTPITYHEFQNYLNDVYQVYDTKGTAIRVTNPLKGWQANQVQLFDKELEYDDNGLPVVKKGFPIQGFNLFRLEHVKQAYDNYRHLYDSSKATFIKHHPDMEGLATAMLKGFHMDAMGKNEFDAVRKIKDGLMAHFTGMLSYKNADGTELPLNANDEPKFNDNSQDYYGAQAFIQRFIRQIDKKQKDEAYKSNTFIQRLKIGTGNSGLWWMNIRSVSGITEEELQDMVYQFRLIDQDKRNEFIKAHPDVKEYWYSPLQLDFLKFSLLDHQLSFGSSRIAQMLPTDMKTQVQDNLFHMLTVLMSKGKALEGQTMKLSNPQSSTPEEITIRENRFINNVFQEAAFKTACNNPAIVKEMTWNENAEYLKSGDAAQRALEDAAELEETAALVSHHLKYDYTQNVYYHYELKSPDTAASADKIGTLEDYYPMFLKSRHYLNRSNTELFVRVAEETTEKGYKAWYRRVGTFENGKSILGNMDSALLGFNIREMYKGNRPAFADTMLLKDGILRVDADLERSQAGMTGNQQVLIYKEGDYALERADIYRVVKRTSTLSPTEAEQHIRKLTEQMLAINDNYNIPPRERAKQIKKLAETRISYFPQYQVEKISKAEGVRGIKMLDGNLNTVLERETTSLTRLIKGDEERIDLTIPLTKEEKKAYLKILDEGRISKNCA